VVVTWPLVGRTDELEQIDSLIRAEQRAIVIAGPAGVGKTRLAAESLEVAAGRGLVPLRIAATRASASLPLGTFASLVPDLAAGTDLLGMLRQIAHEIVARGGGKPVVLMVDDAHLLDDLSAALTHLLATQDGVCVLATVRSGEIAPDPIVALWKDGLAERIELRPLGPDQVAALLAAALHDPVDGATAHLLHKRTEGNVLFLREIVLGTLGAGALRRTDGIWRMAEAPATSARLVEIIEARLVGLEEAALRTLTVLALGEPLETTVLQDIEAEVDLETLERRGVLRIERDDRRLYAHLVHPLYGEVLRDRVSPLSARASARVLAEGLTATGARRREDSLRLATWSLEAGSPVPPSIMLAAATTARQRHDFPLAERLARAAVDAGAGFEAQLLLGQVCWLQGRAVEAEELLRAIVADATTDSQRALLANVRITVLDFGLKRPDQAVQVAEEAEATISDPLCRDQITAERARILGRSGQYGAAVALTEPVLSRASGRALVSACFAAATSMTFTGQTASAIEATERGLAAHLALPGQPLPFGPHLHLMMRAAALMIAGHLAKAHVLAEGEYKRAIADESVEAQPWFSWILAATALNQGRLVTAARLAGEASGGFRDLGWSLFVRNALMIRAHALALMGEPTTARGVLAEIDDLEISASAFLGPEVLRARAWTEVAAGSVREAGRFLDEAAVMAQSGEARALESAALHDLARLDRAGEVAPRLLELSEAVEGPLARARAVHAMALASRDASSLEEASSTFEACGALLLAAEAAADAAVAWRKEDESRKATAAERRSTDLASRCERVRTPALRTAVAARAVLRPRELEIARLAAEGLSNKEIAGRLFLSYRTVENHLHAAYERLGVKNRAGLAQALE
jgi:ATP/maltotriose-dependent transcriptional regulator MalT